MRRKSGALSPLSRTKRLLTGTWKHTHTYHIHTRTHARTRAHAHKYIRGTGTGKVFQACTSPSQRSNRTARAISARLREKATRACRQAGRVGAGISNAHGMRTTSAVPRNRSTWIKDPKDVSLPTRICHGLPVSKSLREKNTFMRLTTFKKKIIRWGWQRM